MNVHCHKKNSVNLDAVKFDAFYLVKLNFGKYFYYFDANRVAVLLQLHLQLAAIRILVLERVKDSGFSYCVRSTFLTTHS